MYLLVRCARLTARGIREASSFDLVRAIRLLIVALVASLMAVSLVTGNTGYAVLGELILAEELYETGVLILVRRAAEPAGRLFGRSARVAH